MRFSRFPRGGDDEASPQRVAAAKRAVQRDREKCGLFPEMMQFQTAEQRVAALIVHRKTWGQEFRDRHAASWRKVRRELRMVPDSPRRAIMRYWQTGPYPGSPEYLAGMIHDWRIKGRCWWHALADRRRMQLVGMGKLPRPGKWTVPSVPSVPSVP